MLRRTQFPFEGTREATMISKTTFNVMKVSRGQQPLVTNKVIGTHNGQLVLIVTTDVAMPLCACSSYGSRLLSFVTGSLHPFLRCVHGTAHASRGITLAGQRLFALFRFFSAKLSSLLFPLRRLGSRVLLDPHKAISVKTATYLDLLGIWVIAEGRYNHENYDSYSHALLGSMYQTPLAACEFPPKPFHTCPYLGVKSSQLLAQVRDF